MSSGTDAQTPPSDKTDSDRTPAGTQEPELAGFRELPAAANQQSEIGIRQSVDEPPPPIGSRKSSIVNPQQENHHPGQTLPIPVPVLCRAGSQSCANRKGCPAFQAAQY
jgi:hypothetical protein